MIFIALNKIKYDSFLILNQSYAILYTRFRGISIKNANYAKLALETIFYYSRSIILSGFRHLQNMKV